MPPQIPSVLSKSLFAFKLLIFGFFTKNRHKKAPQIHCGALLKYIVLGLKFLGSSYSTDRLYKIHIAIFYPIINLHNICQHLRSAHQLPVPRLRQGIRIAHKFADFRLVKHFVQGRGFIGKHGFRHFANLFKIYGIVCFGIRTFLRHAIS